MQKKSIITIIGILLILFVLFKLLVSQFCDPIPKNVVVNATVNVVADNFSNSDSVQQPAKKDLLSWDPILRKLATLASNACPK